MYKVELQHTAGHFGLDETGTVEALRKRIKDHIMAPANLHNLITNQDYAQLFPTRFRNSYEPPPPSSNGPGTPQQDDYPEWGGIPSQPTSPDSISDQEPSQPRSLHQTPEPATHHPQAYSQQPSISTTATALRLPSAPPPSKSFLPLYYLIPLHPAISNGRCYYQARHAAQSALINCAKMLGLYANFGRLHTRTTTF